MSCVVFIQNLHANGESKPAAKRNQKTGKKAGGKSGKDGSKKNHNSRGETTFCTNDEMTVPFPYSLDSSVLL